MSKNWISSHKIEFSVTKLTFESQNSILFHKSQFCDTKLNFVSQNSILSHKSQFCDTKLNFVSQNSIQSNKIKFCVTKLNFESQSSIMCHKIEFCVTELNFVTQKSILWYKFSVLKLIEIVILWVYYTIPFGLSFFRYFFALFFNNFLWLRITDEGSIPEMRIWSILLIKSDLKWCIHLSRSLYLYFNYLLSVTAGGTRSPRGHM